MTNLYVTADRVGQANHGAGSVTFNESQALRKLGEVDVWDRGFLELMDVRHGDLPEPWKWDLVASGRIGERALPDNYHGKLKLAHFYAGTFGYSVEQLLDVGAKVSYTAAAHDVEVSRREHEKMGFAYDYPHLTDPELLKRYLGGYLAADLVICPSNHSADVMRRFGCKNVKVIPHGVDLPSTPVKPLPKKFTVGYLGNCSAPDKGLVYLLQAWKQLNWSDAVLMIAGHDSQSPFVMELVRRFGGGNVFLRGWVKDVSEFYDGLSLYVQPSVTEGFGIEVLEAMAHGRAVVCSSGAGAADSVRNDYVGVVYDPFVRNGDDLGFLLESAKNVWNLELLGQQARNHVAGNYTWDKIRARYVEAWKELLR